MNDPHGVCLVDGEYHMYYQYVPEAPSWEPGIHWGHCVSADLVTWREVDVALAPTQGEVGCWSGSVAVAPDGPRLFYTRPTPGDWGRGAVVEARATTGMDAWQRTPDGPVIDGPPTDQDFIEFRDPHVRRTEAGWSMLLGAGIRHVGGCVLQYRSTDLQTWTYDGVLAVRPEPGSVPMATGTIWECPQLIEVDGQWVLLVSAENWEDVSEVLYAIGDYDGRQFTARTWGRFGHTRTVYATTTFRDAEDRPCAISWLRETHDRAPEGSPWAGAQSLVHVLRVVDGRLVASPHPHVEAHVPETIDLGAAPGASHEFLVDGATPWRLRLDVPGSDPSGLVIDVEGDGTAWTLVVDLAGRRIRATRADQVLLDAPLLVAAGQDGRLDLVVDAGLAEIAWSAGEGIHAAHVPAIRAARVAVHRPKHPALRYDARELTLAIPRARIAP